MDHRSSRGLQQFKNYVDIKFQLYNSLFTSLPFHRIEKTGILLSMLLNNCEEGYKKKMSPVQILEEFFEKHTSYTKTEDKLDLLFRMVQFVERQVVLFDALEDAAFSEVNDFSGLGTLKHLESEVIQEKAADELAEKLKDFSIRLVLTAHPTQFYPGPVLGIINDLARALSDNNASLINMYLQQLGKTPFLKKQKPTPYDEAISLIWYLENVFYQAAGRIISFLKNQFPEMIPDNNPVITMGFWPGGDRDGNPHVTVDTTLKVAEALRGSIIKCYYLEVRRIARRLTFKGVDVILSDLEQKLYENIFIPGKRTGITKQNILEALYSIREILIYQHNSLFLYLVENLINKVHVFGLHFASLDIRQDSSIHNTVLETIAEKTDILPKDYASLPDAKKQELLLSVKGTVNTELFDGIVKDTLLSIKAIKEIQQYNGPQGCHRYIISHCSSVLNMLEVFALFSLCGWKKEELNIDIVPLFETIDDLEHADETMEVLYSNDIYRKHLQQRQNRQTIMVGFSDGTKDGGYLMANWGIYKAKEALTSISRKYDVDVVFFDGRGGPPARGGGKTHKFYASMGKNISNKEIQLTIQGQTVSSNFGTINSAQFNIEQLLNAGITNDIFPDQDKTLTAAEEALIDELAHESLSSFKLLKNHPDFLNYLSQVSPLKFYSATNIGSRPAKRGGNSSRLSLKDLRAIPFVGAWSQLKQNVTGYYGLGTALEELDKKGKTTALRALYKHSMFFKTLIDNCEMAMKKCFFPLTEHLASDPQYGEIWNMIYKEYELTRRNIFRLSGNTELMSDYPVEQLSVQMRERIVLPLITIQQYGMARIRELEEQLAQPQHKEVFEKLVTRCSFGIINAGRNSA